MKYLRFFALIGAVLTITLSACKKDGDEGPTQAEIDEEIIQQYIADNGLVTQSTASGLHYIIEVEGTGVHPLPSSTVTVNYKGYLTDSTVFDQTTQPFTSQLAGLIKGWQEGIPKFREGGEGILILPSELGYGSRATGSIPANSVLIFEIELIAVQ